MDTREKLDADAPDLWSGALSDHRTRQAHHIAAAAMALIGRDGVAALSMSALAQAAGVSRQTLYKYFADVDAVLVGLTKMASEVDAQLAGTMAERDPAAALELFVRTVLEAAAAGHPSPLGLESALPGGARDELRDHTRRTEKVVIETLGRGVESGAFRADLDPVVDGRIVYRTVLACHDLAADQDADVQRLVAHITAAIIRMVAPQQI